MQMKRLIYQIRMFTISGGGVKRTDWLRKHHVYGHIGPNVMIQSRKIPLYPELIKIGSNVRIASGVSFITHDVVHNMLNNIPGNKYKYTEKKGRITIGDNCFIGANCIILYDVTIGNNCIIGAGSVVTKNIPDGSVCAGVPCKVISDFESFKKKRM